MKKVRFQDQEIPATASSFTPANEPAKKIDSVQFGLMKATDIQKSAEIKVVNKTIYQPNTTTLQVFEGGPLDMRMGISEKGKECKTCGKTLEVCPGHFGYVELELPVFHIGYFKQTVNILQSICKTCCRVMISEKDKIKFIQRYKTRQDAEQRNKIFKTIVTDCKKVKKCPHCEAPNGTVKKLPNQACRIIHAKYNDKANNSEAESRMMDDFLHSLSANTMLSEAMKNTYEELDALKVYDLFERIKDEDVPLFDMNSEFCRPIDLLITHIPVPPSCIRPSVPQDNGSVNEDDLTLKLAEVLQLNANLKMYIQEGQPPKKLLDEWLILTYTVTQYFNSDTPGLPYNLVGASKAIRSFSHRLKGKQGRFRLNLSAKRVDFTGRTVISPDPNCAIDEVMIPIYIAKNLTYPERVNQYNMEKMRRIVQNGPEVHPGANYVDTQEGSRINLSSFINKKKVADELKIGDIVERHLENGDVVLFNRQPSLHRVSIMAHKARVMPSRTFRFNECVCTPYNADFDGDEMNIHFPQSEEARAEARILMDVKQNLLVPKSGDPLIAATQDFLTSCYLITQKDMFLNRSQFMTVCAYFGDANERIEIPPPSILKPVELWTGKQVINVLLRPNQKSNVYVNTVVKEKNYSGKDEHMCHNDGWVIFQNSELICGNLCKTTMGSGSKVGLFYSLQRDNSGEAAARCMLRVSKFSSRWLSNYGMSIGINDVTPFTELNIEKQSLVSNGEKNCEGLIQQYKEGNLLLKAGCNLEQTLESYMNGELSKIRDKAGEILRKKLPKYNAPLIMAICGSKGSDINLCQMIALVGQQTVNGQRMPNGFFDRSLPHFEPYSKYPASKGFVKNSFYSGLTATEFFFHTCGGREGLVDTAVKTAETGYMQRRLMKALEDLSIKYDETVRTSTQHVIQFQYGDDGLDPMFMDDNNQPVSLKRLFTIVKENTKQTAYVIQEDMLLPQEIINAAAQIQHDCPVKGASTKFIEQVQTFLHGIAKEVAEVRQNIGVKDGIEIVVTNADFRNERKDYVIQKLLRNFTYVTQSQLEKFIRLVWEKYQRSMIQAGEAVGAVAAQSIGEPGTQMTLKTFHFAGVASMNVTLGVPRIKEIINATKDISTPIISAKLVNEKDVISARIVKGRLEKTLLGEIASYIKEMYTPKGCYLEIELDLHATEALKLEISVQDVEKAIISAPKLKIKSKHIEIVDNKTLHILPVDTTRGNMYFSLQQLKNNLPNVIVTGIPSVVRAVISKDEKDQTKHQLLIEGTGLREVMSTPGIDFRITKTNHIMEIEKVLGIEAARQNIINEIQYTMQSHGMRIDIRHVQLLADIMTFKGVILGITRFGVTKMKTSTLMLASFEMTTDILYESATHCRKDEITGVSECIIMGNMIPVGTGIFKVMYDETVKGPQRESMVVQQDLVDESLAFDDVQEIIKDKKLIFK